LRCRARRCHGWSTVVDASGGRLPRCFLTAFDRLGAGQAGLAWSEAGDCSVKDVPKLWSAFSTVTDG
jgi:hypothetical protein